MSIQRTAATFVLGLMFLSLVVIYLVVPPNPLVTFISILIMTISLIVTLSERWRQIAGIAALAVLVSLIAAHFLGLARYGRVGGILVPALWGLLLLLVFSWIQRNMQPVGSDRAIMIRNMYTSSFRILEPPLAPPLLPVIERIVAIIPLYPLREEVAVDKINTLSGFNIETIKIEAEFNIANRTEAGKFVSSIVNRGHVLNETAKEMGQNLEDARTDVMFWEKVIRQVMRTAIEDIVREVVFEAKKSPVDIFKERAELNKIMKRKLTKDAREIGVEILDLDIERMDVAQERFKSANKEKTMKSESEEAQIKAEREANRIRITRQAEADSEAARIEQLVRALKESGVPLSPETLEEIVVNAIRATTDWEMETAFTRYPPEPPAKPAGDQKGSDDKRGNVSK